MVLNDHATNDLRRNAVELFNITEYDGLPCASYPCTSEPPCGYSEGNNTTCLHHARSGETSVELDGSTNAVYSYTPPNLQRNDFDLMLKTKYSTGLVFYVGDTSTSFFSKYLSLVLVNGFLQFETKVDKSFSAILLRSKVRIDDGRWHRVEIER